MRERGRERERVKTTYMEKENTRIFGKTTPQYLKSDKKANKIKVSLYYEILKHMWICMYKRKQKNDKKERFPQCHTYRPTDA